MTTLPLHGSKIVIVEDDPDIRSLLADLLVREGATVHTARDGQEFNRLIAKSLPDLVILDLMLPGEDGLSICRRIRVEHAVPIIMLTARGEDVDRIIGLEMGADDYLPKPFNPRELIARIKAVLRRSSGDVVNARQAVLGFGIFQADLGARTVRFGDDGSVPLTSLEFELLHCFVKNPMTVLSRDQLLDWTRGRTYDATDRTIDVQVSRLRRKLESCGAESDLIRTVRNGGYMLATRVDRSVS